MPERESMNPEVAAALRAYEVEVRDGTERSQRVALERLRALQRSLGNAAVIVTKQAELPQDDSGETQLAAS